MSYIALYREWRPTRFKDVVEQEHVVKALRYSVSTGRLAHAYLFCGTRGTGKTTMAHILSRAVNCLDPDDGEPCNQCEICREILAGSSVDVLEIDAASNNSVDNVRSIRDEVIYAPTKAKRKVYIIDEVHMLSTGAFNALLKTLEEPPEHAIFILATTEPHKLPATILSRCQRFDFRRISLDSIVHHLDKIASTDGITLDSDAAKLIARMSDGAMRDAISLLDQCISLGKNSVGHDDVLSVAGIVNDEFMTEFVEGMLAKNVETILQNVNRFIADGRDTAHFVSDLVMYFRNLMICKSTSGKCEDLTDVPSEVLHTMKKQAKAISLDGIMNHIRELSALEYHLKAAVNPRVLLEVTLIKLCGSSNAGAGLEERVAAIERRLEGGNFATVHSSVEQKNVPATSIGIIGSVTNTPGSSAPFVSAVDTASPYPASTRSSDGKIVHGNVSAPTVVENSTGEGTDNAVDSSSTATGGSEGKPKSTRRKSNAEEAEEYKDWPKVMNHLKTMGRMTIYSFLLNVKAVLIDSATIGIVAKDSTIRSTISKVEHIKMIEDAVLKATGSSMAIKCLDEVVLKKAVSSALPSESSDLLKRARSIADKTGLPLEIIDE